MKTCSSTVVRLHIKLKISHALKLLQNLLKIRKARHDFQANFICENLFLLEFVKNEIGQFLETKKNFSKSAIYLLGKISPSVRFQRY